MRDNKKFNIPYPSWHQPEGYSIFNASSVDINDPKEPEKYSNTGVKYGARFYSCHMALDTCCCEV
jgi:hypothetical protein